MHSRVDLLTQLKSPTQLQTNDYWLIFRREDRLGRKLVATLETFLLA